ncbi:MAG: hypothetical protein HY962_03215 [Ignavibacteriae bacterium]|nr:hypothetical protein [Ignavibacteriota bacterium]
MKHLITLALAGILLVGLAADNSAFAQNNGKGKASLNGQGNQGKVRPNFVDANGDGICDNQVDGTCVKTQKRLRDGSCGITPAPAGGTTNSGTGTGTSRGFRGGRK